MVTAYLSNYKKGKKYDIGTAALTAQHFLKEFNFAETVLVHSVDDYYALIIFTEEPAFVISHFLHKFLPFWRWVVDD